VDELSQRSTVEAVAEHSREGNLDLDWARRVLGQYEDLRDMAEDIAKVVFALRWPRAGEYSFEIDFDTEYIEQREPTVTASYWTRGDTDSFHFPLAYLFMSYNQIVTAEDIIRDEAAAAAAARLEEAREESRRRDIATLRSLRERYPDA